MQSVTRVLGNLRAARQGFVEQERAERQLQDNDLWLLEERELVRKCVDAFAGYYRLREYLAGFQVIDGLSQHPSGHNFYDWLESVHGEFRGPLSEEELERLFG